MRFRSLLNRMLLDYSRNAMARGREWALTKDQFTKIILMDCSYCGAKPVRKKIVAQRTWKSTGEIKRWFVYSKEKFNGIDRIDNKKGYTKSNCIACCSKCNWLKGNFSKKDFLKQIKKVYLFKRTA